MKKAYILNSLYLKVQKSQLNKNIHIKTWSRASRIYPEFINKTIYIYNGKRHIPILIKPTYISYALGDFVKTRHRTKHTATTVIVKPKENTHLVKKNIPLSFKSIKK